MGAALVTGISIYPVKGEPGRDLEVAQVEAAGLAGDRRKKAPVQLVSAEDVRADTRANLVVSLPAAELAAAVGSVVRVGKVELEVTSVPSGCPGVYARVRNTGQVRLGDPVEVTG